MIKFVIFSALAMFFSFCHLGARSAFRGSVTFHDNLNYSPAKDRDNGFDLYQPSAATRPTPAAVFIHGGYWRNQSRSYYRAFTGLYENFGLALASRGIATAVIDYRIFPRASLADEIADVAAALEWLRAHAAEYHIDPERIYLVGHSAGGHLALMTAWQAKAGVRGTVALSPILDIAHMRLNKEADFNRELTVPFFGPGARDAEHSPATYARAGIVRTLALFGENDYPYLVEQSRTYEEKFRALGLKQVTIRRVAGLDHAEMVTTVNTGKDKLSDQIAEFILQEPQGGKP